MLRKRKTYVLRDEKLRTKVIWLYYDILVEEYEKQQKITKLVTKNFWWPEITKKNQEICKRILCISKK